MPKFPRLAAFALLLLLCLAFVGGDHFIRYRMILPGFVELERSEAEKDITRCLSALKTEINHVEKLATDWGAWDDLYQFVVDGKDDFVESNFQWQTLLNTGIHLMYVIDTRGKVVYGGAKMPEATAMTTIASLPDDTFPGDHPLLRLPIEKSTAGLYLTEHGPMLLAVHQILTSDGQGPSRGTLLLGRFLGPDNLRQLAQQTQVDFSVRDGRLTPFSDRERTLVERLSTAPHLVETQDDQTLVAYGRLDDLFGQPGLLVSARLPRFIMERGRETARFSSMVVLLAIGVIVVSFITVTRLVRDKSRRRQEEIEALVQLRTEELRLSEERLHALVEASSEAIFITEADICLEENRAAETLFGYDAEQTNGRHLHTLIAPQDRPALAKHTRENQDIPLEIRGLHKNGGTFPVRLQSRRTQYRGRDVRVNAFLDLSQLKEAERERALMEEKLHRVKRMESIGMIAGGVAHDLNNILSGIISYPELLLLQLPEDSPMVKPLKAIKESGKSAAAVVDDLLTLARGATVVRKNDNINAIVDDYLQSPEFANLKSLHPQVTFRQGCDPALLNCICSTIHIRKCLMNLVTNAAEAIAGDGAVTISTHNRYCEAPLPGYPEMARGEYAVLTVGDTGGGIPTENLARIFEPFYSSKAIGRSGTGLGLAMIWNIVQDHGGGIAVESGPRGTTFELFFPATRAEIDSAGQRLALDYYRGHGETVLVVDDDQGQRAIAGEILERLDYRCQSVASGEEAVAYVREQPVDLIILDMLMPPGMNGAETFKQIVAIHPRQLAIIASGFAADRDLEAALAAGVKKYVKKPYLMETLAAAIKDTLAGR